LLGDATDNKSLYEEAWKLSGCRSSRAQKHWAFYYYARKEVRRSFIESIFLFLLNYELYIFEQYNKFTSTT
jgi:hypothetical protein